MQVLNAAIAVLTGLAATAQAGGETPQPEAKGPGPVVVHTALGGFILGYDIDPDGSEGLLSEALTRPDGRHDIAVETFDQATGAFSSWSARSSPAPRCMAAASRSSTSRASSSSRSMASACRRARRRWC